MRIRQRILLTCVALILATMALGVFVTEGQRRQGYFAVKIYVDAVKSISRVRNAETSFVGLRTKLDRAAEQRSAAAALDQAAVDGSIKDILEDLDIAIERAMSEDGRKAALNLRGAVAGISANWKAADAARRMADIAKAFDQLVGQYVADGLQYGGQIEAVVAQGLRASLIASGLIAMLMLAISLWLGRALSPLGAMIEAIGALARGDTQVSIPGAGRKDEVAAIAQAMLVFKEQAIERSQLALLHDSMRDEAIQARKQTLREMANFVETETTAAIKSVGDNAQNVRDAAEEMSQFAASVSLDTQSVAAASEQAMASAQTLSTAAEDLTRSIQDINSQVSRTAAVAREAVTSGATATNTVRSLTDAIARISDVTKLIGDIASQTNLLALNATIEAARAGEAGRGFAVVASEVKTLAAQTARSTEDINRQVAEIQAESASAVTAMTNVGVRIEEIDQSTLVILNAIGRQAAATQEITRSVSETAASAREVASRIQQVSEGATRVGSQSDQVRQAIGEITDNISGLQAVMVRVVRSSNDEADRREFPRYSVSASAEILDASSRRLAVELVDLSGGGAKLSVNSGMQQGEMGQLRLAGLPVGLPFRVRASEADALHVKFELSGQEMVNFQQWFDQRVGTGTGQALAS